MRLFFAVWAPAAAAVALREWALQVRGTAGGRAIDAASIHLTLAFLGEVRLERAQAAIGAARRVRAAPHDLPIEEAGYWAHNRIIWTGPRETPPALEALAASLGAALGAAGFELEHRRFAAHVTLLRKARVAGDLPPLPSVDWPVREFVLVRSTLEAAGSRYEVIERFTLDE